MSKKQVNHIEKEIKFKIDPNLPKEDLEGFLKKLGLTPKEQILQTDVYWDNQTCDIINLKRGLRARYVTGQIKEVEFKSLFKKKDGQYVVEEIKILNNGLLDIPELKNILVNRLGVCKITDFDIKNPSSPEIILSEIGLAPMVTLEKERHLWTDQIKSVEISVDSITDLGMFVEIEQTDNTSTAYNNIVKAFSECGFATPDLFHSGYLDLILDKNNKICSRLEFENKFDNDYMWNVLDSEKDIYTDLTQKQE